MPIRKLIVITTLAVVVLTATAFGFEGPGRDLCGSKYFPAVKEAIAKAEKSIVVVMFTVDTTQKPQELVGLLIEAKKRGVEVRVVLDQNVDFVSKEGARDWDPRIKSTNAYKRLREAGIDVHYDEPTRYAHAKVVVVDARTVIMGSTNWTGNSFDNNIETNVMIESRELAGQILEYLNTIQIDDIVPEALEPAVRSVPISRQFLTDPGIGPRLVKGQEERSFDLYLYLVWRFEGDAQGRVMFFYDEAAKYLGIYDGWTSEAYRRQIIKVLKKLDRKFNLIRFEPRYAKEASIILLDYEDPERAYSIPLKSEFRIPREYFELGWRKQLSQRAKFCYLVNLAYTQDSDIKPFWSKSVATISRQCGGVGKDIIFKGMGELRRRQLLEVRYDELGTKPYDARRPKMYKLLALYDPAVREAELAQLEQKYGAREYARARKFAKVVFEENNPQVIEEIIGLVQKHGLKKVAAAFAEVARKNIDNPKRSYTYVLGMLKDYE